MAIRTAIDDNGNLMTWDDDVAQSDWASGTATTDNSGDDFGGFDQQAIDRQQQIDLQEANKQLQGDPLLGGGNASGGSGGGLSKDDSSWLASAAKALGLTPEQLTRMGLGGLAGAALGKILSNQPQGVAPMGIQSFTRTPNVPTAVAGAQGTGGQGGGVRYFDFPNSPATSNRPTEFRFDPSYYLNANPDVAAYVRSHLDEFGGDPNRGAYEHFTKFGIDEQRRPSASGALTPWNYAAGGQTPAGLGYLRSSEDGMADRIPATIDNRQPAKLSGGEFVIPADVVSHLGNGNSDAGAKQLHDFMARIRKARTGNQRQGKRIDPAKFFPKGRG